MTPGQQCIAVEDTSQVGEVRRAVARLAQLLPLPEPRRADAAIIATELATNLWRHGRQGRILLQAYVQGAGGWLEMLSIDAGPGMSDIQDAEPRRQQ